MVKRNIYKHANPSKPLQRRLVFKRENLLKGQVPNKPGIYRFYDKNGKLIYVGHARRLRHRVQSYYQKDCPKEHPTKMPLRKKIHVYEYRVMPKKKAQTREKILKKKTKYNVL
jgi:excinuclease ABC subunit C